jgi:hypothetical protein
VALTNPPPVEVPDGAVTPVATDGITVTKYVSTRIGIVYPCGDRATATYDSAVDAVSPNVRAILAHAGRSARETAVLTQLRAAGLALNNVATPVEER